MKIYLKYRKYLCAFFTFLFIVACQTTHRKIPSRYDSHVPVEVEADHLLTTIQHMNHALETFKGIGNLKLIQKNKKMNLRVAWIGTQQGNFRVEIFGFPGQSAARYSNDGTHSYLFLPLENSFYVIDEKNPSLKQILTIPIRSNDLHAFLSGKIPVMDYNAGQANLNISDEGYALSLKKRCFGDRKKIYMDKHNKTVRKIEFYNAFGILQYRTELNNMRSVNGYTIPFEIIISNNEGNHLYIYVDKYWTDTPVSLSAFTLTPPN